MWRRGTWWKFWHSRDAGAMRRVSGMAKLGAEPEEQSFLGHASANLMWRCQSRFRDNLEQS